MSEDNLLPQSLITPSTNLTSHKSNPNLPQQINIPQQHASQTTIQHTTCNNNNIQQTLQTLNMHTNNIHTTSTTLLPYTCSSTHLTQQESNIVQHTPQTFTASLSQAHSSPPLYTSTTESPETLIYPSTSCQPMISEQSRRKSEKAKGYRHSW